MRSELAAKRRVLVVVAALFLSGLAGAAIGSQSVTAQGVTPAPDHLTAVPIVNGGVKPTAWMAERFCVAVWWQDEHGGGLVLCAEPKGDELKIGAGWKIELPPAWLALVGKRTDGAWLLGAVAKTNNQPPAAAFVAVDGPMLITVSVNELPTLSPTPPATVTPSPPLGTGTAPAMPSPTFTPTPRSTPTPFIPSGTPVAFPTLSPTQLKTFSVYCESNGFLYYTVWGNYGLTVSVPREWCDDFYAALLPLLKRISETMPTRIYYR